jgi:GNAT superfamily N-acetyltransferase
MKKLSFFKAEAAHAEQLVELINSAYRGESSKRGWTSEADLLEGLRTDTEEIRRLIAADDSIIMLCLEESEILGSVHLQKVGDCVQIGMLAVSPPRQGFGIGKLLLQVAEETSLQTWLVNRFCMSVISSRHELIAFYQRLGFRQTGKSRGFPVNPLLWTPKVADLRLEILEKVLEI